VPEDNVQEVFVLGGVDLEIERPRSVEHLIDEEVFDRDDEFIPYWADVWAAGVELAEAVSVRSLRGASVIELGCGLALPSFAAALAGGRVVATDWAVAALALVEENAARNGLTVETAVCDWRSPDAMVARAPWDLVLAADVLYERRNVSMLLDLLPRLSREVWLADPGREFAELFWAEAARDWTVKRIGRVHRMRRR
jgi:predicted nicotinamide N-methyase